jgi:hypothetical protein
MSLLKLRFHIQASRCFMNAVFLDVTPCGSCSDVSEERSASSTHNIFSQRASVAVTANVVPSSPILVTLVIEGLSFSETSVLTRTTRRNNTEDGILHSHRRENLKYYIALTGWAL